MYGSLQGAELDDDGLIHVADALNRHISSAQAALLGAIAEALVLRVELLADVGLAEDAVALAEGLRNELRDADDPEGVARCDLAAGRALLRLGDTDRAADVLEAAATVLDALGRSADADAARRLLVAHG